MHWVRRAYDEQPRRVYLHVFEVRVVQQHQHDPDNALDDVDRLVVRKRLDQVLEEGLQHIHDRLLLLGLALCVRQQVE